MQSNKPVKLLLCLLLVGCLGGWSTVSDLLDKLPRADNAPPPATPAPPGSAKKTIASASVGDLRALFMGNCALTDFTCMATARGPVTPGIRQSFEGALKQFGLQLSSE